MFVVANTADVIPRSRLVAEETLADLRIGLAANLLVDHLEVHHVVARRGLVALRAGLRRGRWVAEFGDCPLRRAVALRAVGAEEADVPVFGLVTRRAVEQRLRALQMGRERWGIALLEPGDERRTRRIVCGSGADLLQTNARQGDVIHLRRARDPALMFEMAHGTCADVGVKGARLALQDGLVVGVADNAVFCLDTFDRRVTRGAVAFEKGVPLRELSWNDRALGGDLRGWVVHDGKHRRRSSDNYERNPKNELSH